MEERGLVAATAQKLLPRFACVLRKDAEEQEDEESLQGGEDGKEDLGYEANDRHSDGQSSKQPGDAKQEHDPSNTNREADHSLDVKGLVLPGHCAALVSENDHYHDGDHSVENNDGEYRTQECHEEHDRVSEEAAVQNSYNMKCNAYMEIAS